MNISSNMGSMVEVVEKNIDFGYNDLPIHSLLHGALFQMAIDIARNNGKLNIWVSDPLLEGLPKNYKEALHISRVTYARETLVGTNTNT